MLFSGMGEKIAAGAAFTMQLLGGTTAGIIVAQAQTGIPIDPETAAAYGAIGALFSLLTWLVKGRIDRCDKQQDSMLTTTTEQTATMRELGAAVNKAADVATGAVAIGTTAFDETKRNGAKLDAIAVEQRDCHAHIKTELAELRRDIERLSSKAR